MALDKFHAISLLSNEVHYVFCRIGRNIATIVELALPDFQFYKFNLEIKEGFENLLQQPLKILC